MKFPDSVDGLLAALDQKFPEVVPEPGDDPNTIMHKAGQRSVVAFLRQWRASAGNRPPEPRARGKGRNVPR